MYKSKIVHHWGFELLGKNVGFSLWMWELRPPSFLLGLWCWTMKSEDLFSFLFFLKPWPKWPFARTKWTCGMAILIQRILEEETPWFSCTIADNTLAEAVSVWFQSCEIACACWHPKNGRKRKKMKIFGKMLKVLLNFYKNRQIIFTRLWAVLPVCLTGILHFSATTD